LKETRAGKYGRFLATLLDYVFDTMPSDYKEDFVRELETYSFEPRKKGTPRGSGCVYELEDIDRIDVENPEDLAKLIKEGIHLMYQKQTAKKVMDSLLENL